MFFFDSIILGVIQGLTEFLPISSTAHLVLVRELFGMDGIDGLAFDAVLHVSTACAVIVYFFSDIKLLLNTAARKLSRLPVNERDLTLIKALLIGTVPAVFLGLLLEAQMESLFRNPLLIAIALVVGSILFMYAEWRYINMNQGNEMTVRKGLLIGLFQSLALIPGMSRSGSSIAGGMLLGLSRSEAARFSFLLAIPIILGGGIKQFLDLILSPEPFAFAPLIVGAVTSFLVGLAAIHITLSFVRRHSLWPFIWYRIILAGFIVFIVFLG